MTFQSYLLVSQISPGSLLKRLAEAGKMVKVNFFYENPLDILYNIRFEQFFHFYLAFQNFF
jgi:hypothetical protein